MFIKQFHSTGYLFSPNSNDQEDLHNRVDQLNQEWTKIDDKVESLTEAIRTEEQDYEVGEGETEVSKYLAKREEKKDRLVGQYDAELDQAYVVEDNTHRAKSILLNMIAESTKNDIKTFEKVLGQFDGAEDSHEEVVKVLDRLRDHQAKTTDLKTEFEEFTSAQNTSDYQDSSDVHQTDFNSFEPFGEE